MLDQLLSIIGNGVVFYGAIGAILCPLLWLLHVVSGPIDRLDRWLKSKAKQPQRPPRPEPPLRGYSGYDSRIR